MTKTAAAAPRLVTVRTADGAHIAVKRKVHRGATPVLFLHGLAVNADLWDLPDVAADDFQYRSLAGVLHDAGYDIWLMNFRGHGAPHMYSEPPAGQSDWCVDHYILYDVPAVFDHVAATAGRKPIVVANSLGAMAVAAHLQGASLKRGAESDSVIADPELAARRQRQIAGCVLVEFPAALRWPRSLYDDRGRLKWDELVRDWWRSDGDVNYPFELLSRWGWLEALIGVAGKVKLDWLRLTTNGRPLHDVLPEPLATGVRRTEKAIVQMFLKMACTFNGGTQHRAEVMLAGRQFVIEDLKAGVLRQLSKSVRARGFVSNLGSPDLVYSDHYHWIACPLLVLAGGRDRIANPAITREAFFDKVASADKTFRLYEEIAHGEFGAAPIACRRVFPEVVRWIGQRVS